MKKFYLSILLMFIFLINQGQENPKIDKKSFFYTQQGLDQAKKDFKKAEAIYEQGIGYYDEALKSYLKVFKYNASSKELNYKIGICYLWSSNKKASLGYLLKSDGTVASDYYLALGRAYQYNIQYDEAKKAYNDYLTSLKKWRQREEKKKVDQLISECENSKSLLQDSLPVFIENLGPLVNSYYDDYGAYFSALDSVIYFTSKRPVVEPKKRVSRFKFDERLMTASNCIDRPCEWVSEIDKLTGIVNMGLAGIDKSEKRIYIYQGKWHNGSILSAEFSRNKWRKVKPIKGGINHIAYKETCISIADDGTAYYITDRRGGEGGKDIWMSESKGDHKWGKPVNLGSSINTPFDESTVYVTRDGLTLYFASNGRSGMGGHDIYTVHRDELGNWSTPKNMGHPINSPAEELYYHPTTDTLVALYATIREDSYGGLDIYKVRTDPSIPFKLIGAVTDALTGTIIQASVNIFDNVTDQIISSTNVDANSGIYMVDFKDGGDYYIEVQAENYLSKGMNISCPKDKFSTIVLDFQLERLKHPFSLIGNVRDIDNQKPIQATILFKDAVSDSILGRSISNDSTGQYTVTFPDKYDMILELSAVDYFSDSEPFNSKAESEKVIVRDFSLKRSKIDYILAGRILNEENSDPIGAALSFYRPGELEPFNIIISDSISGKYTITVNDKGPFLVEIEGSGYFFLNEAVQFEENQTFLSKDFNLKPMSKGAEIVVENILFNSGKATLQSQSFKELDKLATLLIKNSKVRIEVSGHTDNVGSSSLNKKISKSRALTVKNYLVSRGVEDDRVEYIGLGFDQPIAPNDTPEGREKNRRVQVKVLN